MEHMSCSPTAYPRLQEEIDDCFSAAAQVLTVHSPFRVENLTNQQLEFNVHLFRGPQTLGAPSKGAAAISVVPNNPLAPGQQTYLPVPAIWSHPKPP